MIRAPMGNQEYWIKWATFGVKNIQEEESIFRQPSANPIYRPQYVLHNVQHRLRYMLQTCTRLSMLAVSRAGL